MKKCLSLMGLTLQARLMKVCFDLRSHCNEWAEVDRIFNGRNSNVINRKSEKGR